MTERLAEGDTVRSTDPDDGGATGEVLYVSSVYGYAQIRWHGAGNVTGPTLDQIERVASARECVERHADEERIR